jgi:hypothetical protein
MHLSPTSRISSAISTASFSGLFSLADLYSATIDSGEFIVIVVAVESASHEGRPSLCAVASCSIFLYIDWIWRGAGTGPGRACAALMSAFTPAPSLDIARGEELGAIRGEGGPRTL